MSYYMMSTPMNGLGAVNFKKRRALRGFGATAASPISSGTTWSDCEAGAAGNNAAGKRCGQAVQMALNKLGYGPIATDGQIGSGTIAALKSFGNDNGFANLTWPTEASIIKMQELIEAGEKPGPGAAVESHVVGGEVVPGATPGTSRAGLSTGLMVGIGALVLVGIGALALTAKKKSGEPKGEAHKAAANW